MSKILSIALKDLKILLRDKAGAFFVIAFPILMGLFFGLMMSGFGGGSNTSAMRFAIIDQDNSEISKLFSDSLSQNKNLEVDLMEMAEAQESVRKGNRVGLLVIPEGFGKTAGIFWEESPAIQLGMDPSRSAESGMIQGFIMEAVGQLAGERFSNPSQFRPFIEGSKKDLQNNNEISELNRGLMSAFYGSIDNMLGSIDQLQDQNPEGEGPGGPDFKFANIETLDITRSIDPNSTEGQIKKMTSQWDISFPQAMMWGILGCVAGFAISIARERTLGTLVRLEAAPITWLHILSGKALACFLTAMGVVAMMTTLGVFLGLKPTDYIKLTLAAVCVAFCFVGIMMTMSVLGKTEQSVSGSGWAINMVMAMLGGCMIPVMFMPRVIQQFSFLSPIRWAILSIEGAIWRDFSYAEMLLPCAVLIGVGIAGITVGTLVISRNK